MLEDEYPRKRVSPNIGGRDKDGGGIHSHGWIGSFAVGRFEKIAPRRLEVRWITGLRSLVLAFSVALLVSCGSKEIDNTTGHDFFALSASGTYETFVTSNVRLAQAIGLVTIVFLFVFLRHLVTRDPGRMELDPSGTDKRLVVIVHGVGGGKKYIQGLKDLARQTFPNADLLSAAYPGGPFANTDPYRIANLIEIGIHDAHTRRAYNKIVLVGHSVGAMLLRKALVWGHGIEDDRKHLGSKGRHDWVDRVDRLVSIAGINRGWSINPKPKDMNVGRYLVFWLGEKFGTLSGTGKLLLSVRRGSPFIADLRVQWIRLARDPVADARTRILPFVVDLLGDQDGIVAREDAQDLAAAKDIRFMTVPNVNHATIVTRLATSGVADPDARALREKVRSAMADEPHSLPLDVPEELQEDLSVRRIVYILHGIRDYGVWGELLRQGIEAKAPRQQTGVAVFPAKYGYFPMMPFLLYWDRQRNVRIFMDDFTENLAKFPRATTIDYVGHSNGTYILASALQRYNTLKIRNVYFAGSVVPKHYGWIKLIEAHRVEKVRNVVAADDWVVALFPRFFEQIADWRGTHPTTGVLDIGSAGFRGFEDGADALGRVRNFKFAVGGHGTGVDASNPDKLRAIVDYVINDTDEELTVFESKPEPDSVFERMLDSLSNISWVVWVLLVVILAATGIAAAHFGWIALGVFFVVVIGILYSF